MAVVVHIVLTAAVDGVPGIAVGDAAAVGVGHVGGRNRSGVGDIFRADQSPPGIIGMDGLVGVPRIVDHFSTTMVVGTHGKQVLLGQIHHPLRFVLVVRSPIGMRAVVKVGEVTVEVNVVTVVATCAVDGVVAAIVCAVRVGAGENEDVEIVQQIDDT